MMSTFRGGLLRAWMIVFGSFFSGVSCASLVVILAHGVSLQALIIGPIMVAAGLWIVWMGLIWYSDGSNGYVGGGPFLTVRLLPDEVVERDVRAAYGKAGVGGTLFGASFIDGRLFFTNQRLVFCLTRFRGIGQQPVSIPLQDIIEIDDNPPWQLWFAHSGVTLHMRSGPILTFWFNDKSALARIRQRVKVSA